VPCTLATLPVLELGAIRYFDSAKLGKDVRAIIASKGWRFANGAVNGKMLQWALAGPVI
jgi:hypothetical protein